MTKAKRSPPVRWMVDGRALRLLVQGFMGANAGPDGRPMTGTALSRLASVPEPSISQLLSRDVVPAAGDVLALLKVMNLLKAPDVVIPRPRPVEDDCPGEVPEVLAS